MYLKKNKIRFLNISDGILDITDPCYSKDSKWRIRLNVRPSNYRCNYYIGNRLEDYEIENEKKFYEDFKKNNKSFIEKYPTVDDYIKSEEKDARSRCWAIEISSTSLQNPIDFNSKRWEHVGQIAVDSGMAGFFNNKPDYNDTEWDKLCALCNKNPDTFVWNDSKFGFFAQSGYGDGVYDVYTVKKRNGEIIAVKITF